jgi:two-component system nitrogen regulation sensor histidine kinase GlnL
LDRAIRSSSAGFGSGIEFIKFYDPSLPDASGDTDQMLQVFQNILKNACESIKNERGKIKIRTSYNSGVRYAVSGNKTEILPLQIDIIDNGKGIPSNIVDEIFEPFVSSKVNGTGLGLSLVSKIITSHGGLIECSSEESGTTFTFRLPVWKKSFKDKI